MGCFPDCFTCSASKRRPKSILTSKAEYYQAKSEENLLIKLIRESKEEVAKRVTFDLSVKDSDDDKKGGKQEEEAAQKIVEPDFDTKGLLSVVSPSAPNNRYQDCRKSSDEEGDDDRVWREEEESSESLFSLSIDSRRQSWEPEKGEKEVSSRMMKPVTEEESSDSVLKPIENLTRRLIRKDDESIGVDTSLSSWLIGSDSVIASKTVGNPESEKENDTPRPNEDEKIVGELTIGRELKQCRTTPTAGTVGSFWVHTGREKQLKE